MKKNLISASVASTRPSKARRQATPRISDKTLNGHLSELADEWERIRAYQLKHGQNAITRDGLGGNIYWLNQTSYLGEKFGIALIRDLQDARRSIAADRDNCEESP